jgi:hypothetical protein
VNLFTAKTPADGPGGISPDSVGKTTAGAQVAVAGNNLVLDTSSFYKPTRTAMPIVLATFAGLLKYPDAELPRQSGHCGPRSARVRVVWRTRDTCRCRPISRGAECHQLIT